MFGVTERGEYKYHCNKCYKIKLGQRRKRKMKKCVFGIAVGDSGKSDENIGSFFKIHLGEETIYVPVLEVSAKTIIELKTEMIRTIEALFKSMIKEWMEKEKRNESKI